MWFYVETTQLANALAALQLLGLKHDGITRLETRWPHDGVLYNESGRKCVHGWGNLIGHNYFVLGITKPNDQFGCNVLKQYGGLFTDHQGQIAA